VRLAGRQELPPAPDVPLSRSSRVELVAVQRGDAVNSANHTAGAAAKIRPSTSGRAIPYMAKVGCPLRLDADARCERSGGARGPPTNMYGCSMRNGCQRLDGSDVS